MAEILTESFCERCGTRYTFESSAPRHRRLGGFKTLSKGLRNFVLSDDTTLDDALAAARSDDEREVTLQQLDAFHKTFNFCMSCRQYTCANCWNDASGACLSCSPLNGARPILGSLPATDEVEAAAGAAGVAEGAWPVSDLDRAPAVPDWPAEPPQGPSAGPGVVEDDERAVGLDRLASLFGLDVASTDDEAAPTTPVAAEQVVATEPAAETTLPVAVERSELDRPNDDVTVAMPPAASAAPDLAWPETPEPVETPVDETEERLEAATAATRDLLVRFRPGQSLDEALDAYEALEHSGVPQVEPAPVVETGAGPVVAEAEPVAVVEPEPMAAVAPAPTPEPVAVVEPEPVAVVAPETTLEPVAAVEPEPVVVAPEPTPEPGAAVEPEPEQVVEVVVEPEPGAAVEPEPEQVVEVVVEPEPVAAVEPTPEPVVSVEPEPAVVAPEPERVAEPTPEPAPAPVRRDDRVELPAWQIVAPDGPAAADGHPAPAESLPAAATAEPQWPTQPDDASSLTAQILARRSTEALWAASSAEMMAVPAPKVTIQSCVSCGLSLSATARFCRRCGSRQES
jgi:ribosomal protein L40E